MKKFMLGLDTADLDEIKTRAFRDDLWAVKHVTTNPTLLRKAGKKGWNEYKKLTEEITKLPNIRYVSVETSGYYEARNCFSRIVFEQEADMIAGWVIANSHKILIKVPASPHGLEMLKYRPDIAKRANVTLVFNEFQALRAAELGAFCISPFLGRLDDHAVSGGERREDGFSFMGRLRKLWDRWNITETKILAASIRSVTHVKMSLAFGSEMLTMPPAVYDEYIRQVNEGLNNDSLLLAGVERFRKDWAGE